MVRMNFTNYDGINEVENTAKVNVYPNPAADFSNVSFELESSSEVQITLTDLRGKTVYTSGLSSLNAGSHTVKINTEVLTSGVYILNFKSNKGNYTQKIAVRK